MQRQNCGYRSAEVETRMPCSAGTRSAEKTNLKADKYKFLRQQLGIDFVPIIFTASGGMGEQFQSTGPHTGMIGWRRRMSR